MRHVFLALAACLALTAAGADLPNPAVTPGATNPVVNAGNLKKTVCKPGYTATIRPSIAYTSGLKKKQLATTYKSALGPADVEEDHLIPLCGGGHPRSVSNLWPEPRRGKAQRYAAEDKDACEAIACRQLCAGNLTLAQVATGFSHNWITFCRGIGAIK